MPELPEVETIVRGLRDPLRGRTVLATEVLRPDLISGSPDHFGSSMTGAVFREIRRRGKNLVMRMFKDAPTRDPSSDRPSGSESFLVINLGMSGRLLLRAPLDASPLPTHPGVRWRLDDQRLLIYHDIRRFGKLVLLPHADFQTWSRSLGLEPLSSAFTSVRMIRMLAESASPVRSWLLDQKKLTGVGNIYANEALSLAKVHPRTPANQLTSEEAIRLQRALRSVLRDAIRAQGTTLRDYRTAEGWKGSYARELRVYGRASEPCLRCKTPVERMVFGGRSAFFCPRCQPESET